VLRNRAMGNCRPGEVENETGRKWGVCLEPNARKEKRNRDRNHGIYRGKKERKVELTRRTSSRKGEGAIEEEGRVFCKAISTSPDTEGGK